MMNSDIRHEWFKVLESFNREQLTGLMFLMMQLVEYGSNAPVQASFYQSYFRSELQRRFDVCPACGKNHSEELLGTDATPTPPKGS
jgi:hypothetical protein